MAVRVRAQVRFGHTVITHTPHGRRSRRDVVETSMTSSDLTHYLYRFTEYRSVGEPVTRVDGSGVTITVPVKLRQYKR